MKRALVTGISGQDGSFLAELLLSKGYEVHGVVRRSSTMGWQRLDELGYPAIENLKLHYGDLTDMTGISRLLDEIQPEEVYNLGAQSHVQVSFQTPGYTSDVTGMAVSKLLEAIRLANAGIRFYQASSSEMFGSAPAPQSELTAFHPRSPYGVAKVFAYWATVNYRESYGMFAANGILFNHESERRGENFVTRKITRGVADIVHGRATELRLGNLEARRDWGFAGDYVDAMWRMLQCNEPDDFVVATGEDYSVADFCEKAFVHVGLNYQDHVIVDPKFFRPAEVDQLRGDATKASEILGWKPTLSFDDLVARMVDSDVNRIHAQVLAR
jgi:GDPmannose 4,6-dehydratase